MVLDLFGMGLGMLLFLTLVAGAAFVVASTFGIGGPIILMPALMLQLPPAQAVAIVAPVMVANNLLKLWVFRKHIEVSVALITAVSALPIAFAAAFFTGRVNAQWLRLSIALLIFVALARQYFWHHPVQVGRPGLVGWGGVIGAISGFAGAAGPPTAVAIKGHGLMQQRFVGTVALLQMGLQLMRMPAYLSTGLFPVALWPLTAVLSAAAMLAVLVGQYLITRMPPETYRRWLDGLLLLIALWLLSSVLLQALS